ncbi:DJ-1/PfpI family protein [Xylanimonas ulmi]|uniref:Putative intracellular protease/amidase n=1 Tax=Xylanimonas ulmi TaxID=228973 RepID=A0A4Q7M4Y9_9MICO|nr:DJ-1/PfpI family protein [Xylanibacterium ulmi]RZS62007.1 putative intracellular protease/amidase [Xylanibacterium ulmi]
MRRVGVLIESHYDETEFNLFNEHFAVDGYEVEYLSYLWGQDALTFEGNDHTSEVVVTTCVTTVDPGDYDAIVLIGGYAMDRLRYQVEVAPGAANTAPAVEFLRAAIRLMDAGRLKVGTICHSLWLLCADSALLTGRRVTCAHNVVCDVENAGGVIAYDGAQTTDIVIDGGLITAKHPGVTELFIETLKRELN